MASALGVDILPGLPTGTVTAPASSASTGTQPKSKSKSKDEHPPQARRGLKRAANLLTPRGTPLPAIEEAILQLHTTTTTTTTTTTDSPRDSYFPFQTGSPTTQQSLHRRAHSNSEPGLSRSASTSAVSGSSSGSPAISRRRSDGSAKISLVNFRKGMMDASSFISTRNRAKSPLGRDASARLLRADSSTHTSATSLPISSSPSPESPATADPGSRPKKKANTVGSIRRHFKSASDAFAGWQRPRPPVSRSEPIITPSTKDDDDLVVITSQPDLPIVEDMSLTALSPVQSLDASMAELQLKESGKAVEGSVKGSQSTLSIPQTASPPTMDLPVAPTSPTAHMAEITIPPLIQNGIPMLKVSAKKQKQYFFRLDPDQGEIIWYSKKRRIIPIESIKEIRTGSDARYYREQFQLASSYEDRWFTLVYVLDSEYKTLHLIAATREIFQMWDNAVRRLYDIRRQLMSGLGHGAMRQAVWEKQFWKGADGQSDSKLDFDEVERLCRRLNITPSRDDLFRRFKQADSRHRGYLDFADFRTFVTSLKARPDIERLFRKLAPPTNGNPGTLSYATFIDFMRKVQKSTLPEEDLQRLFMKYMTSSEAEGSGSSINPPPSPARNPLELAIQSAAITAGLSRPAMPESSLERTKEEPSLLAVPTPTPPSENGSIGPACDKGVWTCKAFTSFLLSPDNSAFTDEKMDMAHPLPDYFISSSHNTYLVGHQLVGESTIEGYARALLHGCRSVELDIYDGETEPVIYHGKTLTSKVSLRDICETIARYAFATSPYPIIISAEVHCGVAQQVMIANIMSEVFGDALVKAPVDARPKIEVLPSPEELKGRVLLKAKNLYVSDKDALTDKDVAVDTESSSTETSTSDTDFKDEIKQEIRKARATEAEAIRGLKSEFSKAKNALKRVKHRGSDTPPKPILSPPALTPTISRTSEQPLKVRMSMELCALLVYTVGVKCRGINKKEVYAPEHVFSLSENTANRLLKQSMMDLIKHNKNHLVRIYPKGTRIGSTNYEPHRYWSAGAQLVAINWQTFDLGYMINHAMFQRNNRAGYVLKPSPLRNADKQLLSKRTQHFLDINIISAQQLPRRKDALGREIVDKSVVDPYVEISLHIPDWTHSPFLPGSPTPDKRTYSPPSGPSATNATSARTVTVKTNVVKNNGWNPVWEELVSLPFDCVGDMRDLVFVTFAVKQEGEDEDNLAVYCTSLASLNPGYRHLPLHDAQLSQYLFSTLFVETHIRDA